MAAITTIGHLSWTGRCLCVLMYFCITSIGGYSLRLTNIDLNHSCKLVLLLGGPSAAEFTGKNYLQILLLILQNESEPHRLRLVRSNTLLCSSRYGHTEYLDVSANCEVTE